MKKGAKKGQVERRKHPRKARASKKVEGDASSSKNLRDVSALSVSQEHCSSCGKGLQSNDRALFVEEEVGRVFCSEDCITQNFQAEIDVIEKDYFKHRPKDDLSPEEREQYAHLRWVTIQEPDEIWREKRSTGDYRYTLISRFKPGSKPVWCVCICLFLRGEPSFLYMAFPTRSKSLVDHFRKGKQVEIETIVENEAETADEEQSRADALTDGLAEDGWSQSETLRAEIHQTRDANDIPPEEYGLYEHLLEKTLEDPDELWVVESQDDGEPDHYHFLKVFPDEEGGPVHYVVVAQESEQAEQLEVIEQIPTRNAEIAQQFRQGRQEPIGDDDDGMTSRTIH